LMATHPSYSELFIVCFHLSKMYSFNDEKMLREAKKRDFLRSRLPAGKRWKAKDEADVLTQEATDSKKQRQEKRNRIDRESAYDGATNSAIKGCQADKSIKSFII